MLHGLRVLRDENRVRHLFRLRDLEQSTLHKAFKGELV